MRLAVEDLEQAYGKLTAGRTLAGSGRLYELTRMSKKIAEATTGPKRILAFLLFAIFNSLAQRQDRQPVTVEEGEAGYDALHEPISNAISYLKVGGPDSELVPLALALVDGHIPPPVISA